MSDDLILAGDVEELTDEQRAKIVEFFTEHPDGGFKRACKAAGIRATQDEARALIKGDPDLHEAQLVALGLDETSLFKRLGDMAKDTGHAKQFDAIRFGLAAVHGYGNQQKVELTGAGGKPVEVTVEHDYGRLVDKLEQVGLIRRGPAAAPDPEDQPLLPARTD